MLFASCKLNSDIMNNIQLWFYDIEVNRLADSNSYTLRTVRTSKARITSFFFCHSYLTYCLAKFHGTKILVLVGKVDEKSIQKS